MKLTVTITLKSGVSFKNKVNDSEDRLNKVFSIINKALEDSKVEGKVSFGPNFYRLQDISCYSLKKRWF